MISPDSLAAFESAFDAHALWEDHANFRRAPELPELLRPADVASFVDQIVRDNSDDFTSEVLIRTEQGRPIQHVTWGAGALPVLIWARQHGDEDLCTAAMMDFFGFLADRRESDLVKLLHERLSLHIVPTVNPDGMEIHTRRNSQDIDPNRDAQLLQTSSGQALRTLFERHSPEVCFNMHDQSPRKSTDSTGDLIALSLQACPFDKAETMGPQLVRAKQLTTVMQAALEPWIGKNIARYEADYMPRAFGDSMSRWGVASILIESGGWFGDAVEADAFVARCHFMALVAGLTAVATGVETGASPEAYDALPLEGQPHSDLIIRDVLILDGSGSAPHRGALGVDHSVRRRAGNRWSGGVRDLGDLSIFRGKDEIPDTGLVATPGFVAFDSSFTPAQIPDAARLGALHQRGITSVIGAWDGNAAAVEPGEDSSLRAWFLERVGSLDEAQSRHYFTGAHGLLVHWDSVAPSTIRALVPSAERINTSQSLDLVLLNRGNPKSNRAVAILGESTGELAEPDLASLREHFTNVAIAVQDDAGALAIVASSETVAPGSGWPLRGEDALLAPEAVKRLASDVAEAFALDGVGSLRRGGGGDVILWEPADAARMPQEQGDALRLGAIRHVIVAGRRITD
jgi:hypothetical protein